MRSPVVFVLALIMAAVLPLNAQEPAIETCDSPALFVPGNFSLISETLVVADSEVIAEAELYLNITTAWVSDWSNISLVSPAGTSVQVQAGGGGFSTDFDVTYSDLGATNTGASEQYDCDGCSIKPSGPGTMADFEGQLTDGTWTLNMTTFEDGTLNAWCVRAFLVDAVTDLACVQTTSGIAELTWTNDGSYDEVDIYINGELEATVVGSFPDGASSSYTTAAQPVPQMAEICVVPGTLAAGDGPQACCSVALTAEPAAEIVLTPGTSISSGTPPYFGLFLFSTALVVADLQVDLAITYPFIGNLDANLVSAAGTTVTLHDNNGGSAADIDVTYWQLGLAYGTEPFNCDCYMRASGPGSLLDIIGEDAIPGVWLVTVSSAGGDLGTIDEVALRLYDVGPAYPVQGLTCADGATEGTADLTWTNGAAYDEINIYLGGTLAETLAGPFALGATETYTTPVQSVPVLLAICVEGVVGTVAGEQACCETLLNATPVDAVELLPAATLSNTSPFYGVIVFTESATIEDMQCDVELTYPFIGQLQVVLASPAGTSIFLHNFGGGFSGPGIDVTYWDLGVPHGSLPYTCGCEMQPPTAMGLSEFIGESTDSSAWVVAVTSNAADIGSVDRVELRAYDVGPAYEVSDLACVQGSDPTTVSLTWTNGANYDAINVYVNGVLDAALPGPFLVEAPGSYLTTGQPVPSTATVCIEGVKGGNPGPQICCSVFLFIEPVQDVGCTYEIGVDEATVSWTNPVDYDELSVYLDGALAATLPSGTTAYSVSGLTVPGTSNICVEGGFTGLGASAPQCCTAYVLEAGDADACDSPSLAIPGGLATTTSDLDVVDLISIDEVEVLLDITTTFVGDWSNISIISPAGTTVQVHASGGGSGQNFLVTFDNDGVSYGSATFNCACAMAPSSGVGTLANFAGELSGGTWTLSMTTFTAGTLNTWCLRMFGCALLPPSDFGCFASGDTVSLSWTNEGSYDTIEIYRDDALLDTIDGDETSYSDPGLADGRYKYQLIASSASIGCGSGTQTCRTAVGFIEYCDTSGIFSAPGGVTILEEHTITFFDPIIVDEAEVLLEMVVSFTSDWDVFISSPFGTQVMLHNNNGGTGEFNLVWSNSGAVNTGAAGMYDCGLCLIQPTGPGTLLDFATEAAEGDWILSLGSFATGTMEAWCIAVYEGCAVGIPGSVACASDGNDIDLSWVNTDTYSSIEVQRGGVLVAILAGTATSHTDENVLGGLHTYRILGVSATLGCGSGSQFCTIDHLLAEYCETPAVVVPPSPAVVVLDYPDAITVQEVEIAIDMTVSFVTDIDIMTVTSPAATVVGLYDNSFAGTGAGIDAIFSESGLVPDFATVYECGACRIQPIGTGTLHDFEGELADGDWTLTITMPFGSATLDEWCVRIYEGCAVAPPTDLTCIDNGVDVVLAWTNAATYDSIDVLRNDVVIAALAGSETSYTDSGLVPGHLGYRVVGRSAALDCGSRSDPCEIAYGRVDVCDTPGIFVPGGGSLTTDTLDFLAPSDLVVTDVELFVDITTSWVGDWDDIGVTSPGGSSVQVHDNGGSFTSNFNVTYSDSGAINTGAAPLTGAGIPSIYDCAGCLFKPTGPGAMADFISEIANGNWTLEMTTFTGGTLSEWCVGVFPEDVEAQGPLFLRGDCSGDGIFNALLDALFLLNYQFNAGAPPPCLDAADASGDNVVNALLDALYILNYQFNAGAAPPAPGTVACGLDPDDDAALDCVTEAALCAGP